MKVSIPDDALIDLDAPVLLAYEAVGKFQITRKMETSRVEPLVGVVPVLQDGRYGVVLTPPTSFASPFGVPPLSFVPPRLWHGRSPSPATFAR
jgi:hypothetical protein